MQRAIAHCLPREMALLGLVELLISFGAIYALVQVGAVSAWFPSIAAELPRDGVAIAAILTLMVGTIGLTAGLYRVNIGYSPQRLLITIAILALVGGALVMIVASNRTGLFTASQTTTVAEVLAVWLAATTASRLTHGWVGARLRAPRRLVLCGAPHEVGAIKFLLASRQSGRFETASLDNVDLTLPATGKNRVWGIVIASEPDRATVDMLMEWKRRGTRVLGAAEFQERYLGRIDLDRLTPRDLLVGRGFVSGRLTDGLKRVSDIAAALLLLLTAMPLMAITALAIKIDGPGPVFYRQQRTGQHGKPFVLYKFRSMTVNAEAGGEPLWALKHDPRITRLGRVIRATRIDELPQLANVLHGEMSMVGPRPERPHFVEQLTRAVPFYSQRLYVKPGLTGWAQVNYPYGASVEDAREKLAYDLYYVKNRSFLLDLSILVSTVRVVLYREGAR